MNECKWMLFDGSEFSDSPDYCCKPCEGTTEYCATHNKMKRDAEKRAKKDADKLALKLSKKPEPRAKPNKVSDKRKAEQEIYTERREQFLLNKWCAYHGNPCIPTTVHHAKGRVGSLYLDEKYWVPLCMEAHEWVEKNPKEAKDKGLSFSRLATNNNTI